MRAISATVLLSKIDTRFQAFLSKICEESAPAAFEDGRAHVKMRSRCSGLACFVPMSRLPARRGDHSGGSARQIGQQLPFPTTGPPPMKRSRRATLVR